MPKPIKKIFWIVRRSLLKALVPRFVWPKSILIEDVEIPIRNAPYSFSTKRILIKKLYENDEIALLKDRISDREQIIEMGGSIGILTAIMASKLGKSGKIVSIEASTQLTNYSKSWLEKKDNVVILNGFGFPVHSLPNGFTIGEFDQSAGSLGGIVSYSVTDAKQPPPLFQSVYDLGKIISEHNIEPTILVIDIEGSEQILLDTAPKLPPTVKLILIELHPHIYGNESKAAIIRKIESEGFLNERQLSNVYLFKRAEMAK